MCTCMAYRNPAYLAKVATTADIISGGRVEMGIGAGWYEHEWRAYGYGFPRAGERIAMLDEGVQIFKQMWTNGTATLDGEHYQVDGAQLSPAPPAGRRSAAVDRGRRRAEDPADRGRARAVHQLRRRARGVRAQVGRSCAGTARRSAARSRRSRGRPTTTSSSARPRPTSTTASPGSRSTCRNTVPDEGAEQVARTCATARWSGTPEQIVEKLQRPEGPRARPTRSRTSSRPPTTARASSSSSPQVIPALR